ncbi:hypothetical protein ACOSP7_020414 [Xanthoceras sorbifolium]
MSINETKVCINFPPRIQSAGLGPELFRITEYSWYEYSLPRLELHIALIFAVTQIVHFFLKRFGVSLFTSQLVAGLLFSQAILGEEISKKLLTEESVQILGTLGTFGYCFFLFLIGVKTDPGMIVRADKRASFVGILSVVVPLLCVQPIILLTEFDTTVDQFSRLHTFLLSPLYAVTSFPVITVLLSDLKILNSELGRICQSSALTGDILSSCLPFANSFLIAGLQLEEKASLLVLVFVVAFFAVFLLVLRTAMSMVVSYTPEGKPVNQCWIYAVIVIFLVLVSLTRWFGKFMLLAPYVLGLAVPHGPPLGSALVEKFDSMAQNLFLPLFVTGCSMRVKSMNIFANSMTTINAAMVIVALLVKFVVCFLPQLYEKMPMKDALALAFIMCSKGIVEMSAFAFLNDNTKLDQNLFGFMLCVIICLSIVVPIAVKCLYDPSRKYAGYNRRNLMGLRPNSELPIVAVIHVPDNVGSIINLLEASCPTKDTPMFVNVLHLIKLSGQAAPIFISHQKKRTHLTNSYSENLIVSFNKFEGDNWGVVSVNAFTAVSPPGLMHDDICSLALDKHAAIIILPFHRRWYIDGSIESENDYIRTLNARVLDKAPCSIGIFVDRGNMRRGMIPMDSSSDLPSFNVGLIFVGGKDDQEALTFAKRMAQDTRVGLTVVHLTADQNSSELWQSGVENWDEMRDSEVLKEVKTNGYINYIKKEVADGPDTAVIVRSMVNEFNLIIVGRRHNLECPQTSGLKAWSEFPELGLLGDLFASTDYSGRCSVLVVQQQETVVGI